MSRPPDAWTHAAAQLPVAFAQVREDPEVDVALLSRLSAGGTGEARVVMIASGGDTAATIVAKELAAQIQLVDLNFAQLALTRLKLLLLRKARPAIRPALLGHQFLSPSDRARALAGWLAELALPDDAMGPMDLLAHAGPDYVGRYEVLFHQLRNHLSAPRDEIGALLTLSDPAEQADRVAPGSALRSALHEAFDVVMRWENLVALFGAEATRNPLQDFSRHFAERTLHALGTFPARSNPYLAQLLLEPPHETGLADWLRAPAPRRWPEIIYTHASMVDALRARPEAAADFVHLSNILDWLSPEAAAETLALAWRALRPGGWTVVRQLNSSLEIPPLEARFDWQPKLAADLHARDRSFFYRALHVGRKPAT